MPVIINDFEVVIEPKTATDASRASEVSRKSESAQAVLSRPEDIEQILRRLMQRRKRLHAD
jgi:hypothetical protein